MAGLPGQQVHHGLAGLAAAAEPVEGGWTLSGAKRFVSGCEIADYFLVNALVDGIPTFFGVDRSEAIEFIPIWDTMGLRASRSQLMSLSGLVLREDRRCRPPGTDTPNPIGTGVPWLSVGVAEAAFDALVEHAGERIIPTTGKSLAVSYTHLTLPTSDLV